MSKELPGDLRRQSFKPGHQRKLLLVADESPEFCAALTYAAYRIARIGGGLKLLYVIEPGTEYYWEQVKSQHVAERRRRGNAIFRRVASYLRKLNLSEINAETVFRVGPLEDELADEIATDRDIALVVLGAAVGSAGPGRIISSLGERVPEAFPVPIVIVPGSLGPFEIQALA